MEGIGLDNMLGAEEVEKMFSDNATQEEETNPETKPGEETPASKENIETEETAEVDFSDLLGNQPESVGSEENTEGNGGAPKSSDGQGSPQANLFSSIAEATRDEGVFPDLSDEELKAVKDAATLREFFENQVKKMLTEEQQRLQNALNSGATTDEMQQYQNAINLSQFLENKDTLATLTKEGDEGENLRKRVMYQDYINRGFKHERAVKMIQKSFDDGTDLDDAKEAYNSCKEYYKQQIDDFQQEMEERQQAQKANEQKQFSSLKKHILDTESFYDGVQVDKQTRQKAYDSITKPIYKDEQGNYMNALQKYQREHPTEFMENVALLFALTDEFKSVNKLTQKKVQQGIKKGFEEVANVLNTTRRNGDGTLNLANTAPDTENRENWTLA
jgi:hypothetical protein